MQKIKDLTKNKFGRLYITRLAQRDGHGNIKWSCLCCCGNTTEVLGYDLISGKTKSCGCLRKEKSAERARGSATHGHKRNKQTTSIYATWCSLTQRCTNINRKDYHNYGGRGIKVCLRWRKFENFLEDMGERPPGRSIDRIDNNGNYCKSNCRWATPQQQNRNIRNNLKITFNNKTQLLIQWSHELKINYQTLWRRIYRYNWSVEKALTTPVAKRKKRQ